MGMAGRSGNGWKPRLRHDMKSGCRWLLLELMVDQKLESLIQVYYAHMHHVLIFFCRLLMIFWIFFWLFYPFLSGIRIFNFNVSTDMSLYQDQQEWCGDVGCGMEWHVRGTSCWSTSSCDLGAIAGNKLFMLDLSVGIAFETEKRKKPH